MKKKEMYAFTQCKRENLFVHLKAATWSSKGIRQQHVVTFMCQAIQKHRQQLDKQMKMQMNE